MAIYLRYDKIFSAFNRPDEDSVKINGIINEYLVSAGGGKFLPGTLWSL